MSRSQINPRPQTTPPAPNSIHSADSSVPPAPLNAPAVKTFTLLTFASFGMAILISLLPAVGHDQLWCLYVAQRILHGTKLYGPELLESNPPLIMAMLTLPAALASVLHLPITLLFKAGVLLTEAVVALLSLRILLLFHPALTLAKRWSLAFAFISIFLILPARDLGQRDHLLALLCLPYILAAALNTQAHKTTPTLNTSNPEPTPTLATGNTASTSTLEVGNATGAPPYSTVSSSNRVGYRAKPDRLPSPAPTPTKESTRTLNITIGILAGLGICLKPHHALIPIAIETFLLLKTRNLRQLLHPTIVTLTTTGIVFLIAIRLLTPAYLTEIVPLLRDVYWAIGHLTFIQLIAESLQLHILATTTLILYFFTLRRPSTPNRPAELLILAGAASTLAYYLQGTGWYYQQIPALSFFSAALWLLLVQLADQRQISTPQWTPKAALALSMLALALTAYFSGYTLAHPLSFPSGLSNTPDPAFFTNLVPGTPVAILSTFVDDTVPPITTHHLLMAQRTNNLWVLPAILRNQDPQGHPPPHLIPPARLAELDRLQHTWMVEDLDRWRPTLILVLRCEDPTLQCQVLEDRHDNLLAWFQRDPAFRITFSHYQYLRRSGPYDAYTLR